MHVKVIDGQLLSSRDVTHETTGNDRVIDNHYNSIEFNVIRTPSNLIIISLSLLEMFNPHIDWKS